MVGEYNAVAMVDDSHAVGFVGERGGGPPEHWGATDRVDVVTDTLGKAPDRYTSGRTEIIAWLRRRSRPLWFSTSLAPAIPATSLEVVSDR